MTIYEFIPQYCKDIIERVAKNKELFEDLEIPCDGYITDVLGNKQPYVTYEGNTILVNDIVMLSLLDFVKAYPYPGVEELYNNYLETLKMIEGEDVVLRYRRSIVQNAQKLNDFEDPLDCL